MDIYKTNEERIELLEEIGSGLKPYIFEGVDINYVSEYERYIDLINKAEELRDGE